MLFLFKNEIDILNIAIFSLISFIFVLIIEIYDNKNLNFIISLLCTLISFVFFDYRYFMFTVLYALYGKSFLNFPIFVLFLKPFELNFFILGSVVVILSLKEKDFFEIKSLYDIKNLNAYKKEVELKKALRDLHYEEERNKHKSILREREEISKKLHTSIGHTVSASILEIHALSLLTDDEEMRKSLDRVRENLSGGMVEIRKIIHNMYKSSFDIEQSITELLNIPNIKTKFIFKVQNMSNDLSFDILNIVKESVTNFLKHSTGNEFTVRLVENDDNIILTIFDNGKNICFNDNGIGILSIREIANKYRANMNIITERGFKINIVFKKAGGVNENING